MTKLEQKKINATCEIMYDDMKCDLMVKNRPFKQWYPDYYVCETDNWIILQAHYEIVGAISKRSNVLYDFSRMFYPYSKSLNMYMMKFASQFSPRYFIDEKLTWRAVK